MPCCYALAALLRFLYRSKCLKRWAGILRKMERTLGCGRSVMLLPSVTGRTVAVGCCIHTSTLHQPHIRLFVCHNLASLGRWLRWSPHLVWISAELQQQLQG
jgi:hypothetical protein